MSSLLIEELDDETPTTPASDRASLPTITLTPVETTLRQLLLDVAAYIDSKPQAPTPQSNFSNDRNGTDLHLPLPTALASEPLTLRFTGGWVRDKLLGVGSHDIDVAINKMTGYTFGLLMKQYLEIPGNASKYALQAGGLGGLHKIEANPEKSKHLETVTTRLLGLDIDLVNLRRETYTQDSRTPQMEFGTPEEDALRRDATVNAMFYNLTTSSVEDFTRQGLRDLQARILRTPLEPFRTFEDDPLRVMRLIRFASRLGWEIDAVAKDAMRDERIQAALRRKITRERIGTEMEKALRGPDPYEALRLVDELGLYETVFCDPTSISSSETPGTAFDPELESWPPTLLFLHDLPNTNQDLHALLLRVPEEEFQAWNLAALIPYRNAPAPISLEPGRKPPPHLAAMVAREGVKATNKICEVVAASVKNAEEVEAVVEKFYERQRRPDKAVGGEDPGARDVLGLALRRWGGSWRSLVLWALLGEVAEEPGQSAGMAPSAQETSQSSKCSTLNCANPHPKIAIAKQYTTFLTHLLDGKALAKALDTPPGPWMKDALDVVMAYQLRNPGTATAEGAVEEVRRGATVAEDRNGTGGKGGEGNGERGGELTSALLQHFLSLTIRPAFTQKPTTASKSLGITANGRKSTTTALPQKVTAEDFDDTQQKPWKSLQTPEILSLLAWCISSLTPSTTERFWPLLLPPILTLLDDWEVRYKTLGARYLHQLLSVTPGALLEKTGLGDVFEEALLPCLSFLPPVTGEVESVRLLEEVLSALLALAVLRFPCLGSGQKAPRTGVNPQTLKAKAHEGKNRGTRIAPLDRLLRKGFLHGYSLCGSPGSPSSYSPAVLATLFAHLPPVLNQMGVDSVKHLRFLVPAVSETMARAPDLLSRSLRQEARIEEDEGDTTAAAGIDKEVGPRLLLAATRALQALILNAWPRVHVYRGEIVKGLVQCWIALCVLHAEDTAAGRWDGTTKAGTWGLREALRESVGTLRAAVKREVPAFDEECTLLVDVEPRLRKLFA